jgi:hypothetical protein
MSTGEYMLLTYHDENRQGTTDRPATPHVEITPEMIEAGEEAIYLNLSGEYLGAKECAEAVFRAMMNAAPPKCQPPSR